MHFAATPGVLQAPSLQLSVAVPDNSYPGAHSNAAADPCSWPFEYLTVPFASVIVAHELTASSLVGRAGSVAGGLRSGNGLVSGSVRGARVLSARGGRVGSARGATVGSARGGRVGSARGGTVGSARGG